MPPRYRCRLDRWEQLPEATRDGLSQVAQRFADKEERTPRGPALGAYSTAYAKDEARRRGWRVTMSEYRDRFGRLHDCEHGSDVVAIRQDGWTIYIQSSCPGQRALHRRRFLERSEVFPIAAEFLYWEFAREGALVLEERWR